VKVLAVGPGLHPVDLATVCIEKGEDTLGRETAGKLRGQVSFAGESARVFGKAGA
jgi:hypothetical protein